ncbi:MAG: hypothetical protein V4640_12040 [Verrucomicrobiota bacterium]
MTIKGQNWRVVALCFCSAVLSSFLTLQTQNSLRSRNISKNVTTKSGARLHNASEISNIREKSQNSSILPADTLFNPDKEFSIYNFKPEQFEDAWSLAFVGSTERNRLIDLGEVVSRMEKAGFGNIAIDKIMNSFGAGTSRSVLISRLFQLSEHPEKLALAYGKLEFDDEKAGARKGLSFGLADQLVMENKPFHFDIQRFPYLKEGVEEMIALSIERYIQGNRSKSPAELSSAIQSAFGTEMTEATEKNLVVRMSQMSPFDCWRHIESRKLDFSDYESEIIATNMVNTNPTQAMDLFASSANSSRYFERAFKVWLNQDAHEPILWLEKNQSSLNSDKVNKSLFVISEFAASHGDFDIAKKWAERISDQDLKNKSIGSISTSEKKISPSGP